MSFRTINLSDIEEDKKAGRKTLSILKEIKNSEKLWIFNVIMLLVLTFILLIMGIIGQIGLKYHLAVIIGLLISSMIKAVI